MSLDWSFSLDHLSKASHVPKAFSAQIFPMLKVLIKEFIHLMPSYADFGFYEVQWKPVNTSTSGPADLDVISGWL